MLYEVVAVNETGIEGESYLVDGETYPTSSPMRVRRQGLIRNN
ncbi:hypothetical protein [Dolosigranulum pigrum]|nr:hypothetical protein [Dolosigranulum pigrum]